MNALICLSASEVEQRFEKLGFPFGFTKAEKDRFNATSVVEVGSGVLAFPTPKDNVGLNILKLNAILGSHPVKQAVFFAHPWYLEERFAAVDCEPGWHFLQMEVLPSSIDQPVDYIHSLSEIGLALPSAMEVALMLFLHFAGTGEQLLRKKHTWCSDQATLGRFVTLGAFGANGLFVSGHPPAFSSRGLGICGKIISLPAGFSD